MNNPNTHMKQAAEQNKAAGERTHMQANRRERQSADYTDLKQALLDLGCDRYEQVRARLIAALGYDEFRSLQNEIFREIGTIKFEQENKEAK